MRAVESRLVPALQQSVSSSGIISRKFELSGSGIRGRGHLEHQRVGEHAEARPWHTGEENSRDESAQGKVARHKQTHPTTQANARAKQAPMAREEKLMTNGKWCIVMSASHTRE